MYGWTGNILRVDLSTGQHDVLRLPQDAYRAFLGGKGLGGYLLRGQATLPPGHPDLPLIIAAGPLTATIAPTSGRCHLTTRSPLTGAVADSSAGGRLGTELARAGWDALLIVGRAQRLTGIEIDDGTVRLMDARALAGLDTAEVFALLRQRRKGGSMAATGPAADTGCLFASLMVDTHHAAGRCGLGGVAGAKNLKYLAVRGTGRRKVADLPALKAAREDILRLTAASPALLGQHGFSCYGTGSIFDLMDSRRMMPTDNFSRTRFPGAEHLNAHAYKTRYQPRRHGCQGCHVLCKKIAADGRSMPEFETMSHFTALIGNTDLELVLKANDLCNRLGLDTISAGSTLACRREISGEELSGARVLELLRGMGTGVGPGAELAQGSAKYAAIMGRPELSMSVKGLELPAYDPRGAYGMALAYATSARGGCHLRAYPISHEILRKPVATDRFSFSGKARIIKIAEDANAVVDSLIACKFLFFAASLEEYARAYTAVTGVSATAQDLLAIGERIDYQERLMNAQNGFSAADDDLPPRFFNEEGSSGPGLPIPPVPRQDFLAARAAYYRIRGLTPEGLPTRETAERLGLSWPQGLDTALDAGLDRGLERP
ncbi:MAG: aldehyde ferredoxin oxidoreductase family protein [Proteobacteria bacterium]|nr:aldehyde ferredoxin oxidoreductase family protein [Pseudomonadota bacterium]MBU1595139.1 aldehyde ferredoxin oxidoreductase family protein [Pseudomonadota bacterium]